MFRACRIHDSSAAPDSDLAATQLCNSTLRWEPSCRLSSDSS
jgi:hypothetical protein